MQAIYFCFDDLQLLMRSQPKILGKSRKFGLSEFGQRGISRRNVHKKVGVNSFELSTILSNLERLADCVLAPFLREPEKCTALDHFGES